MGGEGDGSDPTGPGPVGCGNSHQSSVTPLEREIGPILPASLVVVQLSSVSDRQLPWTSMKGLDRR